MAGVALTPGEVAELEALQASLAPKGSAARGPRPTPVTQSKVKRRRQHVRAQRKHNRRR